MNIIFTKLPATDGTIKISLDGGQSFTDYNIANIPEDGISLSNDQDFEKIRIKGPANLLKNLDVISSVNVEGGSGGRLEYLYCYVTVEGDGSLYLHDKATALGEYAAYGIFDNQIGTRNISVVEITDNGFIDEGGTEYIRSFRKDSYKYPPKNEFVDVEYIDGYSLSIAKYNFATGETSDGQVYTNQRLVGGDGYCEMEDCDLAIYIGSGRIGYYKVKQ